MQVMGTKFGWGADASFDAFVVGGVGTAQGGDAAAAVADAGGRLIAAVDWTHAIDRLEAIGARPIVVLDTRGIADERIATALPQFDGLAAGRELTIVAAIDESQIDIVSAGLTLAPHHILCAPRPADWVAALMLSHAAEPLRLHDRVDGEAAHLAHLNAEVARITTVLARLSQYEDGYQHSTVAGRTLPFAAEADAKPQVFAADIRQIVRARRARDRHFGTGLFEDPAWDMILDLYAAHLERAQVSVSSLCIAAAVAPTTALRWIARLTAAGLFERQPDPFDRRRAFIALSDTGLAAMQRYVAAIKAAGLPLI